MSDKNNLFEVGLDIRNWELRKDETGEETKSWLRKLIRRKVLSESNVAEYKAIIEKLGPKLNAFINSTKA